MKKRRKNNMENTDNKYDFNTGKTKEELERESIVASTYDAQGNNYIVKKDKKIYLRSGNELVEVTDPKKIAELLDNFIVTRRDVIKGEEELEK
jgi:hypothetical protein